MAYKLSVRKKQTIMDTKIIKNFGQEILCYRIKTERRKIRDKKTATEKKLLSLNRERRNIWKRQRALGFEELNPPIMKGWKRFFIIREDVARSKDAAFYESILEKINTVKTSNRKDFKKKKNRFGRKNWIVRTQELLQPTHSHLVKLKFTDKELLMFNETLVKDKYGNRFVKKFVFKEPWRFVLKIKVNWITKIRIVDADLENRDSEISDYLEKTRKCFVLDRLLDNTYGKDHFSTRRPNNFKKVLVREILDERNEIN